MDPGWWLRGNTGECQAYLKVPDRASTEGAVSSLEDGLCKVSCQGRVMTGHRHLSRRDCEIGYNQVGE